MKKYLTRVAGSEKDELRGRSGKKTGKVDANRASEKEKSSEAIPSEMSYVEFRGALSTSKEPLPMPKGRNLHGTLFGGPAVGAEMFEQAEGGEDTNGRVNGGGSGNSKTGVNFHSPYAPNSPEAQARQNAPTYGGRFDQTQNVRHKGQHKEQHPTHMHHEQDEGLSHGALSHGQDGGLFGTACGYPQKNLSEANYFPSRLQWHFNVLRMMPYSERSMNRIFTTLVKTDLVNVQLDSLFLDAEYVEEEVRLNELKNATQKGVAGAAVTSASSGGVNGTNSGGIGGINSISNTNTGNNNFRGGLNIAPESSRVTNLPVLHLGKTISSYLSAIVGVSGSLLANIRQVVL
jgi:hypothetical protein